ncbi:hypothetical protein ASG29_05430 [Sphingomonas sp. Leaf412]|uniref:hypothetical protein n=1 Tax=Sphingomonas sp. Leaf412 TaxID=1736370 RepID=UPI0006F55489|nr:hypothetical protein [Sphingomonas sp. Leaf412]KQT33487.1 hypothetical protein ASG29_05430 [Sphingomonas sp. Leaf412]
MILLAFLLQVSDATLVADARSRLSAEAPAPSRKDTRYRIDDDDDTGPDGKTRALGVTGQPCALVGARVCTRKPRTWVKAPLPQ